MPDMIQLNVSVQDSTGMSEDFEEIISLNAEEFLDTLYNGSHWTLHEDAVGPVKLEFEDYTGCYTFYPPSPKHMTFHEYIRFVMDVDIAVAVRQREERLAQK